MPNTFPTTLNNYTGSETTLSAQHSQEHNALELKVGINGSGDTNSLDYKINHITSTTVGLGNVDNTSDATKNAAAVTLTSKRITKRTVSAANYVTSTTINSDTTDMFIVTAQAGALLFNNPTGTPTEGQTLWIAVTGTAARALTWDTAFESSTISLPATTVTTARLDIGFVWRADTSKWRLIALA